MGTHLSRRAFLGATGTAAAAAAGFLYPGAAKAFRRGRQADVIASGSVDPGFAGGEVTTLLPDGVLLRSDTTVRALRINPASTVWKEFDTSPSVIRIGDWVDARGTPLPDGSLQARDGWVWINIGRRDGVIQQVTSKGAVLRDSAGKARSIEFSKALEIVMASDGSPLSGGLKALVKGTNLGAVGLRLPNGGFRATRIWV
jgi:hypothetical protein